MALNVPQQMQPPQLNEGLLRRAWSAVADFVTAPLRFSLAGRVALAFFVFLIVLVASTWWLLSRDPNVVTWNSFMRERIALVVLLVIVTPVVVYYALRLWLEGERSQFPDIDFAWNTGLAKLREHGISLESTPVFLVLGSTNERQEKALLDGAGLRLRVEAAPDGPAALHWYAAPTGIFVFCTETSWLSTFNTIQQRKMAERGGASGLPSETAAGSVAQLPPAAAVPPQPSQRDEPASDPTGTIMLDQFISQNEDFEDDGTAASDTAGPRGTLVLQTPVSSSASIVDAGSAAARPTGPESLGAGRYLEVSATVPAQESARQQRRLQYTCQLLVRARQPVCPMNGVLTLLPFDAVQATPGEAAELERAVKSDLTTIQRELNLRAPVVSLITGLEKERGFRELVRRVGPERAAAQRFGRKFDVRSQATPSELRAMNIHVCGTFEDWIYTLFREQGALSRPGNTRLYSLLCKVRCTLKPRLAEILSEGFGYDQRAMGGEPPISFSGCYFAATGDTPDRQAFVRGVMDKLVDEQEQIEWTPQALSDEARYRRLVVASLIVNLLLLGAISYFVIDLLT